MKLKFLGGAREVGRSGILLDTGKSRILMDYGVKIQPEPGEFPLVPEHVDAIIPTHAHLDHCGAIPMLASTKAPVYATSATSELMGLLLRDFLKIAHIKNYPNRFSRDDLQKSLARVRETRYEKEFAVKDARCKLYDAGHIPGSAGVLVSSGKKNVYYTGDTKMLSQRLVDGCMLPSEKIDTLIIESTYSDRNHPDQASNELAFRHEVDEALNMNEHVLVPSFAVGRAQEMLLTLKNYSNYLVVDGMAKEATEIALRNRMYIRDFEGLRSVYNKCRKIKTEKQRAAALRRPSVIVSTSGMLTGGPSAYYLRKIHDHRDSKVLFVGFQVEGSPGKTLMDTNMYKDDRDEYNVRCKISRFDFSAHAGKDELFSMIRKISPKRVVCVHGDKCPEFASEIRKTLGIDAFAPALGDELEI